MVENQSVLTAEVLKEAISKVHPPLISMIKGILVNPEDYHTVNDRIEPWQDLEVIPSDMVPEGTCYLIPKIKPLDVQPRRE